VFCLVVEGHERTFGVTRGRARATGVSSKAEAIEIKNIMSSKCSLMEMW
jgi:hypothetical protein